MTLHWLTSVASEVAKLHLSDKYRVVDHISAAGRIMDRPGALLHLEDIDSPKCVSCGKRIRPLDQGRFIYFRQRVNPTPFPSTRFCHERCLRRLSYERPKMVMVSDVLAVGDDRMGSVF